MTKHEIIKEYHTFFHTEKGSTTIKVKDFAALKGLVLEATKKHYHKNISSGEIRDHLVLDGFVTNVGIVGSAVWALLNSGELRMGDNGIEVVK